MAYMEMWWQILGGVLEQKHLPALGIPEEMEKISNAFYTVNKWFTEELEYTSL